MDFGIDLDPNILAALPAESKVISFAKHGKTNWSTGFRLRIRSDGEDREYFLKIVERREFVEMSRAEYEGQQALQRYLPTNVVAPIAWGYFKENQSKSFFLTSFRNLESQLPPTRQLLSILKSLHLSSNSPNGMFGFHVTTYFGPPPMINAWTQDWEVYFTRQFRSDLDYLCKERGRDLDLMELAEDFIRKVIPRLLRPLQTGGRSIKPTLCHGDLYDGNIQIDAETSEPILFDSCCFYGHNEMDLQCMGAPRYALDMDFIEQYKAEIGASEPEEDFYDRHALYVIRTNICTAGMWPQRAHLLNTAKAEMQRLLAKFPEGIDGFSE
ncbi:Fructosamine/Ketosamine-3-kinase [Xylariaceae sp. FL1272]|nr:Fructosamine/Ketosamine-3-kinase [Xylariaceae sp. FL1272]